MSKLPTEHNNRRPWSDVSDIEIREKKLIAENKRLRAALSEIIVLAKVKHSGLQMAEIASQAFKQLPEGTQGGSK